MIPGIFRVWVPPGGRIVYLPCSFCAYWEWTPVDDAVCPPDMPKTLEYQVRCLATHFKTQGWGFIGGKQACDWCMVERDGL